MKKRRVRVYKPKSNQYREGGGLMAVGQGLGAAGSVIGGPLGTALGALGGLSSSAGEAVATDTSMNLKDTAVDMGAGALQGGLGPVGGMVGAGIESAHTSEAEKALSDMTPEQQATYAKNKQIAGTIGAVGNIAGGMVGGGADNTQGAQGVTGTGAQGPVGAGTQNTGTFVGAGMGYPQQMAYGGRMYQTGGPVVPPTRQDSLDLLNRQMAISDYYKGYEERTGAQKPDPKDYLKQLASTRQSVQRKRESGEGSSFVNPEGGLYPGTSALFPEQYSSYKEGSPTFEQGDLWTGVMDLNAPKQAFHTGITPTGYRTLAQRPEEGRDPTTVDVVGLYDYDPLAITPIGDLSDEQKIERFEKYGPDGFPKGTTIESLGGTAGDTTKGTPVKKSTRTTRDPKRSLVDQLSEMGQPNSYADRKALAKEAGITGYKGSAKQNKELQEYLSRTTSRPETNVVENITAPAAITTPVTPPPAPVKGKRADEIRTGGIYTGVQGANVEQSGRHRDPIYQAMGGYMNYQNGGPIGKAPTLPATTIAQPLAPQLDESFRNVGGMQLSPEDYMNRLQTRAGIIDPTGSVHTDYTGHEVQGVTNIGEQRTTLGDKFRNMGVGKERRTAKFAYGGEMYDAGGAMTPEGNIGQLTEFNEGGTHEQNPLGGIPQGMNQNGQQNLVEEGETKLNSDDYIYSDTLKVSKKIANSYNMPKKFIGKTYADASKTMDRPNSRREGDTIEESSKKRDLTNLMNAQEEYRNAEMQKDNEKMQMKYGGNMNNGIGYDQGQLALFHANGGPMHQMPDGSMMPGAQHPAGIPYATGGSFRRADMYQGGMGERRAPLAPRQTSGDGPFQSIGPVADTQGIGRVQPLGPNTDPYYRQDFNMRQQPSMEGVPNYDPALTAAMGQQIMEAGRPNYFGNPANNIDYSNPPADKLEMLPIEDTGGPDAPGPEFNQPKSMVDPLTNQQTDYNINQTTFEGLSQFAPAAYNIAQGLLPAQQLDADAYQVDDPDRVAAPTMNIDPQLAASRQAQEQTRQALAEVSGGAGGSYRSGLLGAQQGRITQDAALRTKKEMFDKSGKFDADRLNSQAAYQAALQRAQTAQGVDQYNQQAMAAKRAHLGQGAVDIANIGATSLQNRVRAGEASMYSDDFNVNYNPWNPFT